MESFLPVILFYRVGNDKIKYYDSVLGSKFCVRVYVCMYVKKNKSFK